MENLGKIVTGLAGLLAGAALTVWWIWRTLKQAEDPGRVLFKWILTVVIFGVLIGLAASLGRNALVLPGIAAMFGVVLGILWAPHLGASLAKVFTGFYDGGSQEVEERPFYAIARAKQKRGHYLEAIAEVRKQIARFPEDYEGWMIMAEIQGNDLKDNEAAQECIAEILRHESHTPKNVAFALNRAADWHLSLGADREGAQHCLEEIVRRFPGSELAHSAEQRIAHLTSDQMLAEQRERPRIVVKHYEEKLGLQGEVADPRPPAEDPGTVAARLVQRLSDFPADVEAREELAKVYADHYQRMDLAGDQIEQLVSTAGAGQKEVARWLNMLADFHVRVDQDKGAAAEALRRVIELYPGSAVAAKAETRMAYLDTEMLKNKKSQALKLGSADERMGLKEGWPNRPG